jgi:hypothetical protein
MKTSLEATAGRLLTALEDLVSREAVLLRAGLYPDAIAIQHRATPLVTRLCDLAAQPGAATAAIRRRVAAVLGERGRSMAALLHRRLSLTAERQRLSEARLRLRQVALYGQSAGRKPANRINAAV